ncbi:alpha/beta hydrolase [Kitasatospora sp. NBC_00240]|uniref:alpha/beta hydrolase n=1 Tax=Kitasatospora sp. NBC_00240 TaxID=2903567 RepID=UPI002254471E|nr:alpha/beta hydrolase [Kitasatospora sp. NBC_00240]MCX5209877.1 alpha/beta hydrolase [Kitasatospora sp. NBC_00240]
MARFGERLREHAGDRPVLRRWPSWGAAAGAVLFYCLSLTPSMLPRSWWLQGAEAGVTAAIGYGFGALLGALARRLGARPGPQVRRIAWAVLAVVGSVLVIAVTARSVRWQGDVRRAVTLPPEISWWRWSLVPVLALLVLALVVLVARLLRLGTRIVVHALGQVVPGAVAAGAGVVVVAVLVVGFVQGFLLSGVLSVVEGAASLTDEGTTPGIVQPQLPTLSGSPASLESWQSLGSKGRDFVGTAATKAELTAFAGHEAVDPVRVYVGLRAADTLQGRADLAVAELERTGGFSRKVLAVMATTGSGWINKQASGPLEYMYAGDSAMVAIQYSYLPSWVSVLTEDEAVDAGRALFDAVHAKWATLPAAGRPRLVVFGESLGSFATEKAFDGQLDRLATETDGALLVGPTYDNPLWKRVTADREPGSPVWRPVFEDGRSVRFAQVPADLDVPARPWDGTRIVYLQNGSDPIVWWSPSMLFSRPEWLEDPRAKDVSPAMRWYPVVTFWQVVCDLMGANNVPPGFGHRYGTLPTDAWAAIAAPPGWTAADTARLAALMGS